MKPEFLDLIRSRNPLIHNITNLVSAHFSANGLLALGASPIMADSPEEMAELASISNAVVLNLGTPNPNNLNAMIAAGKAANQAGIPVVLDPVAVAASGLRRDAAMRLLKEIDITAIRGNAGEIAYLADTDWQAKGVDAGEGHADLQHVAEQAARKHKCFIVLSGEKDYISDGKRTAVAANGTPLLPKITASGCLLSTVCGAFLAVSPKEKDLDALAEACTVYAVAGEIAAQGLQPTQSGSFMVRFLDALAAVDHTAVAQAANVVWHQAA